MINFTVGPVQASDTVCAIGGEQVPYFRTAEFSAAMLENERLMLRFANAPTGSRAVFMTASGTGSMEAAVVNVLTPHDKALVVNGGSFGHRFVELLTIHGIPFTEIVPPSGDTVTDAQLAEFDGKGYTAFLVNVCETSTGVLYDMTSIGAFCRRNGMLLIADSISSFLADPFDMAGLGADVMITGSQKALACPPGVSVVVLSPRALARVEMNDPKCLYLDLRSALKNQERGQTPFTPAVGTLLQIHARLTEIAASGGVESETNKIAALARYFREQLQGLPFDICSRSLSNAVTPLHPTHGQSAYDLFLRLKDEFGIWVCPNGGELKDTVFRVGHLGALSLRDYDRLIAALRSLEGNFKTHCGRAEARPSRASGRVMKCAAEREAFGGKVA